MICLNLIFSFVQKCISIMIYRTCHANPGTEQKDFIMGTMKLFMFRPMYSKQVFFCYLDPIWINISVFLLVALLKLEITVSFFSGFHCQFIQGH